MGKHWFTFEDKGGRTVPVITDNEKAARTRLREVKADKTRMLLDYSESLRKDAEK
jgi:hypothetical protein